ncbi:MAG: DUF1080 domain-containing protein [Puniceicoccales bacterium]|jgi:hypothetical protein|nr:DUF1080 domain-containing protein [Puniceicoccales bacterium]
MQTPTLLAATFAALAAFATPHHTFAAADRTAESSETAAETDNRLTAEEQAAGWKLLWNGKDSTGWRSVRGKKFPKSGWEMKNGILTILAQSKAGDIITEKRYTSFELTLDFLITPKANSGIKYFAQTGLNSQMGIGLEYQILDDKLNPDAKKNKGTHTLAALYDLIAPPADKPSVSPGSWHNARLVVNGGKVEHYLDGVKTVEYDRHSDAFRALVQKSKYKNYKQFGEWPDGHILLQDHNDRVSFKNIKLREIGK